MLFYVDLYIYTIEIAFRPIYLTFVIKIQNFYHQSTDSHRLSWLTARPDLQRGTHFFKTVKQSGREGLIILT